MFRFNPSSVRANKPLSWEFSYFELNILKADHSRYVAEVRILEQLRNTYLTKISLLILVLSLLVFLVRNFLYRDLRKLIRMYGHIATMVLSSRSYLLLTEFFLASLVVIL
jgi:hypothetical protein